MSAHHVCSYCLCSGWISIAARKKRKQCLHCCEAELVLSIHFYPSGSMLKNHYNHLINILSRGAKEHVVRTFLIALEAPTSSLLRHIDNAVWRSMNLSIRHLLWELRTSWSWHENWAVKGKVNVWSTYMCIVEVVFILSYSYNGLIHCCRQCTAGWSMLSLSLIYLGFSQSSNSFA